MDAMFATAIGKQKEKRGEDIYKVVGRHGQKRPTYNDLLGNPYGSSRRQESGRLFRARSRSSWKALLLLVHILSGGSYSCEIFELLLIMWCLSPASL